MYMFVRGSRGEDFFSLGVRRFSADSVVIGPAADHPSAPNILIHLTVGDLEDLLKIVDMAKSHPIESDQPRDELTAHPRNSY